MISDTPRPTIVCFGEILWDSLPQGLFPGGAPMNVAYHLKQLGARAIPVTAVGNDVLGDELIRRLQAWGIDTEHVMVVPDKPSGLVRVQLISAGQPTYQIVENVAWDWIAVPETLLRQTDSVAVMVFGSLAQRSEHNVATLATLRERCQSAFKVFDVNLRPPFANPELIWRLARGVDLIKLNIDELSSLLGRAAVLRGLAETAQSFADQVRCSRICVTVGSDGAGLLDHGQWFWADADSISVKDTIGAGDAFLAALIKGLLDSNFVANQQIIERACRLAEFVAASEGATPAYHISTESEIIAGR
jgi:fructokinase